MTKPSNNIITQGYSSNHPGLDYSGKGDPNVYATKDGLITISRDNYKTNWLQGKEGDPTPWGLTTEDYGNFLKIQHDDNTSSISAHLKHGTPLKVGTRVSEGQKIAEIGNTGNSTGPHLHFELRDKNNKNIKLEFQEKVSNMPKESALDACLRQHRELVTELDQLKPKLKQAETDLDSCTRSKAQIVSERDKLKAIRVELVKLTGKEVDKAEDDVANALNHYYVTERNKEVDTIKQEKATTAPQKAVTEGAKEPVRIALSALVGFAVTTAYTKYPFLGQIEPDQQLVIVAVVGVLTRTLNEFIHNYGKNIGNDLLKTGFLDISLVSYAKERLMNSAKNTKGESSNN